MKLKFVSADEFYSVFSELSEEEVLACREFTDSESGFDDFEIAYSYAFGCMILRYYSEEAGYHFEAPIPLVDFADVGKAFVSITEYCVLETIEETVIGISPDVLDLMLRGAERYSLAEDEDGSLAVRIVTECMECEFIPEVLFEDLYLGEFANSYADKYEELLKNVNLNRHFGYNILDDMPNGTGIDFIENARREFENAESITLAATICEDGENVFVGEGTLYAFDGRGNACVSFRVLPEYHRRGIGRKIFRGLLEIAKQIGLKNVIAEVKNENVSSLCLLSQYAKGVKNGEKVTFEFVVSAL